MKYTAFAAGLLGLVVALAPAGFADSKIVPSATDQQDDIAVQTRGPVHEAYAAPMNPNPRPGPVVPKQPPQPIKELPPDDKPQGDNVEWIPGYWGWDSERNDYVWVSGFWRVPPPGRQWVAGHWVEATGGWQWVPGFWASTAQAQLQYIDQAPPESLEDGPSVPAPDDNSFYVPGSWVYRDGYAWRPGYWSTVRAGYVWVPAEYVATPAGYCYVDGYWDYPLEDRGLLFAPVCFNQPLWLNPDWCYRPRFCLNFAGLLANLFVRPDYCHYYFGDYYGPGYLNRGFTPWFAYGRRYHDPLYGYYGWSHRGDPGWYRGLVADYRARVHGDLPRPPHTLSEQNRLAQRFHNNNVNRNSFQIVQPLNQVALNSFRSRSNQGVGSPRLENVQRNTPSRASAGMPFSDRARHELATSPSVPRNRPAGALTGAPSRYDARPSWQAYGSTAGQPRHAAPLLHQDPRGPSQPRYHEPRSHAAAPSTHESRSRPAAPHYQPRQTFSHTAPVHTAHSHSPQAPRHASSNHGSAPHGSSHASHGSSSHGGGHSGGHGGGHEGKKH